VTSRPAVEKTLMNLKAFKSRYWNIIPCPGVHTSSQIRRKFTPGQKVLIHYGGDMDEKWWPGKIRAETQDPEHYDIVYEDEDDSDPWSSFKHIERIRPWSN
jgi:hypothetical protein